MTAHDVGSSNPEQNDSWWRSQALALALELSAVRGHYESELAKLKSQSDEAISWLEEKLAEEKIRNKSPVETIRRWFSRGGAR
jgi:succinylglutamate desuccinylase